MKQTISARKIFILVTSFILAIVIVYSGFLDILTAFFLVGAIPGTNTNLPPTAMLAFYLAITWLLVFRFSITRLTHFVVEKNRQLRQAARKRNFPKRRFGRV